MLLADTVMSGKGDAPRNCYSEKFRDGWDKAFGKKDGGDRKSTDQNCVAGEVRDGGSSPPTSNSLPEQSSDE